MINNKIMGENFLNTMNLSIEYLKKALENAQFILSKKPRSEEAKKIKALMPIWYQENSIKIIIKH